LKRVQNFTSQLSSHLTLLRSQVDYISSIARKLALLDLALQRFSLLLSEEHRGGSRPSVWEREWKRNIARIYVNAAGLVVKIIFQLALPYFDVCMTVCHM